MARSNVATRQIDRSGDLLTDIARALTAIDAAAVAAVADLVEHCLANRRKVLLLGNGGSCATATHLATDLLLIAAEARLGACVTALHDNPSLVTAMANDYGFAESGGALVTSAAHAGDVLLVLSCSGHSPNLISAAKAASRMDVASVLFGSLLAPSDFPASHRILVQSRSYSVIEVVHTAVSHQLIGILRDRFGLEPPRGMRSAAANACSDRH